jgi:hypothetical protein
MAGIHILLLHRDDNGGKGMERGRAPGGGRADDATSKIIPGKRQTAHLLF